jgi:hypothetical protein
MAKKHWIYIKRGLSEDPKHRAAMGECVWLYMHIIDRADWEKGIAYDWKDEAEAADMCMPVRTLREQRRKLDDLGYISCVQLRHNQNIIIKRWINPREYDGKVMNTDEIEGDVETEPLKNDDNTKDNTKGYTKGSSQSVTPTSNSKNQRIKGVSLSKEEIKTEGEKVDKYFSLLSQGTGKAWTGRETFLPQHLPLVDWYHGATGQDCPKGKRADWMKAVAAWSAAGLTVADLQVAYDMDINWRKVFTSPNQLTDKAMALKAQKKATPRPPTNTADQAWRQEVTL